MNEDASFNALQSRKYHALTLHVSSLVSVCHAANKRWWVDIETGEPIKRNVGELLMLQVSELAEAAEDSPQYNLIIMEMVKTLARAMEGHRKNKMDDKLPHRTMLEVELADLIIRVCDMAGGLSLDLGGALAEKMEFNEMREDHTHEARRRADGKKF